MRPACSELLKPEEEEESRRVRGPSLGATTVGPGSEEQGQQDRAGSVGRRRGAPPGGRWARPGGLMGLPGSCKGAISPRGLGTERGRGVMSIDPQPRARCSQTPKPG